MPAAATVELTSSASVKAQLQSRRPQRRLERREVHSRRCDVQPGELSDVALKKSEVVQSTTTRIFRMTMAAGRGDSCG